MDIATASRELLRGSIADSPAELVIDDEGTVHIDISCFEGDRIPLTADDIRELMVDLAVALRLAENL